MATALVHKADEAARIADLRAAEECFTRIVRDNAAAGSQFAPVVQAAQYNLALCLSRQGNVDAALEEYEKIYFSYRNNYVDRGGEASKPRPLDDFYMTNALVDMIALLEAKGDNDSMDKVRRYRRFLAGRNDRPVSGTAKERLQL